MSKKKHWLELLTEKIVNEYDPPYVITSGMTTSGPPHLGTICEFLYPGTLAKLLKERGYDVKFYFFADIMDAFDRIPEAMKEYEEQLKPHLGKPLAHVPDPTGQYKSLGHYFFAQVKALMDAFDIHPEVKFMDELYEQGVFDDITRFFIANADKAREILGRVSGRQMPAHWFPIQVVCEKCGKIATTRVTRFFDDHYTYACDLDVGYSKGCGHVGEGKLSDHLFKLVWRLHWPAWLKVFGTTVEGAGADHHAKGGSWDTTRAIFRELFHEREPLSFKFGLILFNGKKYSKSKGVGMSAYELLNLLPPQVIAFTLLVPDVQENKDIPLNKHGLLKMVERYERASTLSSSHSLTRAEEKMLLAYRLSGERFWQPSFREIITYYSIYRNWQVVEQLLGAGVRAVEHYVEQWFKQGFVPEELDFSYKPRKATGLVREFFLSLSPNMSKEELQAKAFEFAKRSGNSAQFFQNVYQVLIAKDRGPKLSTLLSAIGVEKVINDVL
jgi:lysyl-tRNA synthetase class 1